MQSQLVITMARFVSNYLLFALATSVSVALYQDEPLVYGTFPDNFIWAAATSAYQIEGGWDADGKGLSIWDVYTMDSTVIADGSTGQIACDSYHLYETDVQMLKFLNVTHYRFSISWPRILPEGIGRVNQAGIDYYNNLIDALKAVNIEPMVTLYHWDLPHALQMQGGWLNPQVLDWFDEFARLCFSQFGDRVKFWITINEPWVVAVLNYGHGQGAPALEGPGTNTYLVGHHLILAHARVYRLYHSQFHSTQQGQVGITLNIGWNLPKSDSVVDQEAAERGLQFIGGWFAEPIFGSGDYPEIMKIQVAEKSVLQGFNKSRLPEFTEEEKLLIRNSSDFFGLNHYSTSYIEDKPSDINWVDYYADQDTEGSYDPSWYGSATDWLKITPFGMRYLLQWIKDRFNNPKILITENGIGDNAGNLDDLTRVYYYKHYINNVLRAIRNGVNVIGYTAWSLMDNYEWNGGYLVKFGIFSVNFTDPTLPRTPKASARYYAKIIEDNGFIDDQPCDKRAK